MSCLKFELYCNCKISDENIQFTLTRSDTSRHLPALFVNLWWTSRGAFYQFLIERVLHLSTDEWGAVLNAAATSADWAKVVDDLLEVVKVSAFFTAWIVGTNFVLTRVLPPYRRVNAAVTAVTSCAPNATLTATAIGGAIGVLECALTP